MGDAKRKHCRLSEPCPTSLSSLTIDFSIIVPKTNGSTLDICSCSPIVLVACAYLWRQPRSFVVAGAFPLVSIVDAGALISDVADGAVARKLNQVTNIGGLLDHGSDIARAIRTHRFRLLWRYSWALPILVVIASLSMFGTWVV